GHDGAQDTSAVAFGSNRGDRAATTDAVQLQGIQGIPLSIEDHAGIVMEVNAATTDIVTGDVMIACDFDHATVFQVSGYDAAAVEVSHDIGVGTPGNAINELGFPTGGGPYGFSRNALLGRLFATDWYVGQNGRADEGGRSL